MLDRSIVTQCASEIKRNLHINMFAKIAQLGWGKENL